MMSLLRWLRSLFGKPKPVVVASERKAMSVGYTFCGWAGPRPEFGAVPGVQCPAERPWAALQTDDRMPAMGYYDEREPAVTLERLRQCETAEIECVAYQVEWAHEHTQPPMMPKWRPSLPSPLINSHCADNHPETSPVKFFISWWDVSAGDELWQEMKGNGWTREDVLESQRRFAREVATRYMGQSNYLRIDDRPVLMRGAAENLEFYEREFGIRPSTIVTIWRSEVRKVTGKELYLVAVAVDPAARSKLKGWGFDGLTEYLLHGDSWLNAMAVYDWWWQKDLQDCRKWGLDFWVPATAGYDGRAWNTPESQQGASHMPTPVEFRDHVRQARSLAVENFELTRGMVCLYAMTEFGEGGIIEAMQPGMLHDGDAMLRAHREACA